MTGSKFKTKNKPIPKVYQILRDCPNFHEPRAADDGVLSKAAKKQRGVGAGEIGANRWAFTGPLPTHREHLIPMA